MDNFDLFNQPPDLSPTQVASLAINQAYENADTRWKQRALAIVHQLATTHVLFTADDVWHKLEREDVTTHEPRALGAIMRIAVKNGWIRKTTTYIPSKRVDCHARPIPVWESLVQK